MFTYHGGAAGNVKLPCQQSQSRSRKRLVLDVPPSLATGELIPPAAGSIPSVVTNLSFLTGSGSLSFYMLYI